MTDLDPRLAALGRGLEQALARRMRRRRRLGLAFVPILLASVFSAVAVASGGVGLHTFGLDPAKFDFLGGAQVETNAEFIYAKNKETGYTDVVLHTRDDGMDRYEAFKLTQRAARAAAVASGTAAVEKGSDCSAAQLTRAEIVGLETLAASFEPGTMARDRANPAAHSPAEAAVDRAIEQAFGDEACSGLGYAGEIALLVYAGLEPIANLMPGARATRETSPVRLSARPAEGRTWVRLRHVTAAVLGALLLAPHVPAATSTSPDPSLVRLFDYDRRTALRIRVENERIQGGVRIQQISFAVPRLRLRALLLVPQAAGRHAGVVIGPEGVADRQSFLAEGLLLARRGAVVLLVDGPWEAAQLRGWPTCRDRDRPEVIRSAVELRRALDVLTGRADVDRSRLAIVGFSYSAWTAGILAGVERRPRAFVLISGEATMTRFLRQECGGGQYLARMRAFDPVRYVGDAAPAALLIQNGRFDQYWTRREIVRLQQAASRPKTVRWYDAAHSLDAAAERDRIAWLARILRLRS